MTEERKNNANSPFIEKFIDQFKNISIVLGVVLPILGGFIYLDSTYANKSALSQLEQTVYHERLVIEQSLTLFRIDLLEERIVRERNTAIPNNVKISDWRRTIQRLERRFQQIENQLINLPVPLKNHIDMIR